MAGSKPKFKEGSRRGGAWPLRSPSLTFRTSSVRGCPSWSQLPQPCHRSTPGPRPKGPVPCPASQAGGAEVVLAPSPAFATYGHHQAAVGNAGPSPRPTSAAAAAYDEIATDTGRVFERSPRMWLASIAPRPLSSGGAGWWGQEIRVPACHRPHRRSKRPGAARTERVPDRGHGEETRAARRRGDRGGAQRERVDGEHQAGHH